MWNHLRTALLLGALSALLVGVGGAIGGSALPIGLVLAIVLNVGSYYFSDRIVLSMNGATPLSPAEAPRLHAMVAELAQKAGLPMPRLYRIADPSPNAFATGRDPEHGVVAVTDGILELLPERELRGVLAHELAHIQHRDILISSIAAVMAAAVGLVADISRWGLLLGGGGGDDEEEGGGGLVGLVLTMFLAPLGATLLQLGLSRSREHLADEGAARLTGDPEGLARALLRLEGSVEALPMERPATASLYIVSPSGGFGKLLNLFRTHPPTEERVARLRALR